MKSSTAVDPVEGRTRVTYGGPKGVTVYCRTEEGKWAREAWFARPGSVGAWADQYGPSLAEAVKMTLAIARDRFEAANQQVEDTDDPVHLKHPVDGYPLCWPMDRDGAFVATPTETAVTCNDCLTILTSADTADAPNQQDLGGDSK